MQPLSIFVNDFLKPVLKGFNPIVLVLMRNWKLLMGEKYCTFCSPNKVIFPKGKKDENGTLYITAYNNIVSFYITNNSALIIEKINMLNGGHLIKEIKVQLEPKVII
ncbi:MAG: hypothetical protein Ta2D_10750 [Rickettsiales bacterium]|nr:MAG: hypothetical protein Ta2D_10750 [Rickettsiales bacterium]